ncbi:TolC family protein [Chryseobacterium sp. POL2]|uniref:TolC family protein n=1 Tax=Chryseobacterium sp. POL2 TaxID=2713414 RepID=UPI0013E12127|nr:TolC family protein [Chryseobacterium sp. POL2]QIG88410.1 TolC family protein [Chryseobacterium sp. POL2]
MKQQIKVLGLLFVGFSSLFRAQSVEMSVQQVADMAVKNHQQLKISEKNISISQQQTEVAKLQKLPSITASTSQFFLGDALIIDKDFSNSTKVSMPHYGSTYSVQAQQLIFKGGLVNKSIEASTLREQLAELDLAKDQQNVKFLVTSNYLDIYRLINQTEVYKNNKKLAQERLKNIQKFYNQGMLTRNEVIRAELAIKNLDQGILVLENNRKILNYQLNVALGLPTDTELVPVEDIEAKQEYLDIASFKKLALENNPLLKSAQTNIQLADKNIEIINTDKMPTIGAFGGYNMQRPITTRTPAMDMYTNSWQAGVSLSYNIDNLYKTKEKVKLGEMQKEMANEALTLTEQNIDIAVNAAFIKHQEAIQQAEILNEAKKLAEENYKITEAKYLNQLVVQAEMTDAQNQKLQSELDYANAEINILYQYYNLLKTTGTL